MPQARLDFASTTGDTYQRFTITAPGVTPTSKVLCSIQLANVIEQDDPMWAYVANVASVTTDSFDVNVYALPIDAYPTDQDEQGPSQELALIYTTIQ